MTILGVILALVGLVTSALMVTGNAPDFLIDLGWPLWVWIVVLVLGLALIVLNRRTAD